MMKELMMLDNLLLLVYVVSGTALAITAATVISVAIASIVLKFAK